MASRPLDSKWLFGVHDAGGEEIMLGAGKPGWILFAHSVGHDPTDQTGYDFRPHSAQGLGVICRLNNGYYPFGTIPHSSRYGDFAVRCAKFAAASPGCRIWIIGNEPNYAMERPQETPRSVGSLVRSETVANRGKYSEWAVPERTSANGLTALRSVYQTFMVGLQVLGVRPSGRLRGSRSPLSREVAERPREGSAGGGADDPFYRGLSQRFNTLYQGANSPEDRIPAEQFEQLVAGGETITPDMYARCYGLCRNAIQAIRGHETDRVLVSAIAPWNNQTTYPGNERGDWVAYLSDILSLLGNENCDGFALHTYSHTADPGLIRSEARMNPPFQDRHYNFRAYQDFLAGVPHEMRHLPVYITETDQNVPWLDDNIGWVQSAYAEIDRWNRQPAVQKVRALVLYRWSKADKWYIDGKDGVIEDFREALKRPFQWDQVTPAPLKLSVGERVRVIDVVNLRRTPGYIGKSADDIVAELPNNQVASVLNSEHQLVDRLVWWHVQAAVDDGVLNRGWIAQFTPSGVGLLVKEDDEPDHEDPPPTDTPIRVGDKVQALDYLRMRRTPGFQDKPHTDIVADLLIGEVLRVVGGPRTVDDLAWWQVRRRDAGGTESLGWVAEYASNGQRLLSVYSGSDDDDEHPPPAYRFQPGDIAETLNFVRLRRSPGFLDKPESDVVADIWEGTAVLILAGPEHADGLTWWSVQTVDAQDQIVTGWMAEEAPGGIPLLGRREEGDNANFEAGELVVVSAIPVRVRRTPGYLNKPDNDVLGEFRPGTTLNIHASGEDTDGLIWYRVGGVASTGELAGWVAQSTPGGVVLVRRARRLPGTNIPDRDSGEYLAAPFDGSYEIAQLWGENAAFYSRYLYDGVALSGHHGVDFLTPTGTMVQAVDDGIVSMTGWEPTGYGHFVVLSHKWGESLYAHLDRIDVQQGQEIARDAGIGASGNSGGSTGPHLHFSIRIIPWDRKDGWGGYSDPLPYLPPTSFLLPVYVLPPEPDSGLTAADRREPSRMAEETPGMARP